MARNSPLIVLDRHGQPQKTGKIEKTGDFPVFLYGGIAPTRPNKFSMLTAISLPIRQRLLQQR